MNWFERMRATVRIDVKGNAKERYLNMCRARHFPVWDVTSDKENDVITMCMNREDFLESKSAIRKTGVKVSVKEKSGLPFLLKKINKRRVFVAGALLGVLFLLMMMRSIWAFQFEGTKRITDEQIVDYLESRGVTIGTPIRELDYEELEQGLREQFPEITWASVSQRGTTLLIRIREREYTESLQRYDDRTDIVADVDGVIVSMIVKEGVPYVQKGDVISEGDILVGGAVPIYDENSEISGYHYYHAQADILVETSQRYTDTLSLSYEKKVYTGKEALIVSLGAFDARVVLGNGLSSPSVESQSKSYQLRLFRYLQLPFFAQITRQNAYEWQLSYYTKEEAQELLLSGLEKYLRELSEKGVQIIAKDVKIIKNGMSMEITADITMRKLVGVSCPTTVEFVQDGENND
ncbi:MAG: sporulation protein YqfD [Lachnospiraceae bacterium]|nr:sporulation protein YqfD [Lachnospiraceae bacterium]MBD5482911.1 sporulation protein YqfD [Lachnospiraceae bacterium]